MYCILHYDVLCCACFLYFTVLYVYYVCMYVLFMMFFVYCCNFVWIDAAVPGTLLYLDKHTISCTLFLFLYIDDDDDYGSGGCRCSIK